MICPVEIANNNEISLDVCPGDSRSDQIATDGAVLLHGDIDPGYRTVEPHTIAYNEANHLALGAWCVSAADASHEEQGWREYLLSEMSLVTVLPVYFFGFRRDCPSDRGKSLHNLQCAPLSSQWEALPSKHACRPYRFFAHWHDARRPTFASREGTKVMQPSPRSRCVIR